MRTKTPFMYLLVALSLAGCGSTTELLGGMSGAVTGYSAGNAFSPLGYRSKEIDETHHTVIATGTATEIFRGTCNIEGYFE